MKMVKSYLFEQISSKSGSKLQKYFLMVSYSHSHEEWMPAEKSAAWIGQIQQEYCHSENSCMEKIEGRFMVQHFMMNTTGV